jgi:hypothetical protein
LCRSFRPRHPRRVFRRQTPRLLRYFSTSASVASDQSLGSAFAASLRLDDAEIARLKAEIVAQIKRRLDEATLDKDRHISRILYQLIAGVRRTWWLVSMLKWRGTESCCLTCCFRRASVSRSKAFLSQAQCASCDRSCRIAVRLTAVSIGCKLTQWQKRGPVVFASISRAPGEGSCRRSKRGRSHVQGGCLLRLSVASFVAQQYGSSNIFMAQCASSRHASLEAVAHRESASLGDPRCLTAHHRLCGRAVQRSPCERVRADRSRASPRLHSALARRTNICYRRRRGPRRCFLGTQQAGSKNSLKMWVSNGGRYMD